MRLFWIVAIAFAVAMAGAATARTTYAALPSGTPFTTKVGAGGTKVTADNVEFWTQGAPARPYQMLGTLTDPSYDKLLESMGSIQLARMVREVGGDAVIMLSMADLPTEAAIALKNVPGLPPHQFWVVKYLPADTRVIAEDNIAAQVDEWKRWTEAQCRNPDSIARRAQISRADLAAIRSEVESINAEIAAATASAPEEVRKRNRDMQRLTMQMLDCQEHQMIDGATAEAIRGGVGTEVAWKSSSRPNVSGRSKVMEQETLADGVQCLTVTDVIIIDGEETIVPKRMCRPPGAPGYSRA